ncbi:MAG TPA: hypothetical protein VNU66_12570, partial [Mycobacteriales bacterium]|nr:hypothetical protein [Mycobacteriales bacterium]
TPARATGSVTGTVALALGGTTLAGPVSVGPDGLRVGGTSGTGTLTVAGRALSGTFTLTRSGDTVTLTATDAALDLGVASLTGAALSLTVSPSGVVGTLTGTAALTLPGLAATGPRAVSVTVDTTGAEPVLVVDADVTGLTVSGTAGAVSGRLSVALTGGLLAVSVSGGSLTLPDGGSVTGVEGLVLALPDRDGTGGPGTAGLAGYLSGLLGSVRVSVRVNTTGLAVDETVVVGGATRRVSVTAEAGFDDLALSGRIDLGPVHLEGDVALTDGAFAGRDLTAFFGAGPLLLPDGSRNPLAAGLLLTGATVAVVDDGTVRAVVARGTVELLGVPGLTARGTVSFRYSTGAVSRPVALPGGGVVDVVFTGADAGSAASDGLVLVLSGQEVQLGADVSLVGTALRLTARGLTASVPSGGGDPVVEVTGGTGTVELSSAGLVVATPLTAQVVVRLPGAAVTGTFTLALAGTGAGTELSVRSGAATVTVGGARLTGPLVVSRRGTGSAATTTVSVGPASTLELVPSVLSLSGVTGTLTAGPAGVTGSLTGALAASLPGVSLAASTLTVEVDTARGAVTVLAPGAQVTAGPAVLTADVALRRSVVDGAVGVGLTLTGARLDLPGVALRAGGGTVQLAGDGSGALVGTVTGTVTTDLPGVTVRGELVLAVDTRASSPAPDAALTGTGVVLALGGAELRGDLSATAASGVLTVALTGAALELAGGVVRVTGATATLTRASDGTVTGSVTGTVAVTVPGVVVTGTFTTALGGGAPSLSAPDAVITVAGLALGGRLTLTASTDAAGRPVVRAVLADDSTRRALTVTAGSTTVATVEGASGTLVASAAGLVGDLALTGLALTVPGVQVTGGSAAIALRPGAASLTVLGGSLALGAGTGSVTLQGDLALRTADGRVELGVARLAGTVGSGGPTVTGGSGALVVLADGVAGLLEASLTAAASGVSAGGRVLLRVNTTGRAVDERVRVGDRVVPVVLPVLSPVVQVSVSDVVLDLGPLTVEGPLTWSSTTLADGRTARTASADGLRVFLGRGRATDGTGGADPLAVGVLLTGVRLALVEVGAGYALVGSGTVTLLGVPGAVLSGTAVVRVNTTGSAVDVEVPLPGGTGATVRVAFPTAGRTADVTVGSASLALAGGTLTGRLTVERLDTGDVVVGLRGGDADLGGGLTLSGLTGALVVTPAGVAGRLAGAVALAVPGLSTGTGLALALNTTGAAVSRTVPGLGALELAAGPYVRVEGTGTALSVAGQELTADVVLERSTSTAGTPVVLVGLRRASLAVGPVSARVATLTGGEGVLVATAEGVAGRLTGAVTTVLPGASVRGTFSVAVSTLPTAVDTAVRVGGSTLALRLPAGPYARFEAPGAVVEVAGQVLTGDVVLESGRTDGGAPRVRLAATGVVADLAGVVRLTGGTAVLVVGPAGLAGEVTGDVTLTVPGVTVAGALRLQVSTATTEVRETVVVDGVPVALDLPAGPLVRLLGSDLRVTVADQLVLGGLTITRTRDALGAPAVLL